MKSTDDVKLCPFCSRPAEVTGNVLRCTACAYETLEGVACPDCGASGLGGGATCTQCGYACYYPAD